MKTSVNKKLLFALALLAVGAASATGVGVSFSGFTKTTLIDQTVAVKRTMYFDATSAWNTDSAKMAAWVWREGTDGFDGFFVDNAFIPNIGGNNYRFSLPSLVNRIIFVRCQDTATVPSWDAKWNQTVNLNIDDTKLKFTITNQVSGGDDDGKYNATASAPA